MTAPSGGVRARLRRRSERPPGSYRPGRLLARVAADLTGYRLEPLGPGAARAVPGDAGLPSFDVRERTERHAFMGLTALELRHDLGGSAGEGLVELTHTGALRRTGVDGRVRSGADSAQDLLRALLADAGFVAAALPLDFTDFRLERGAGGWQARVHPVGGCEVAMRLPPSRSYVRLSGDQLDALVATFAALDRHRSPVP